MRANLWLRVQHAHAATDGAQAGPHIRHLEAQVVDAARGVALQKLGNG